MEGSAARRWSATDIEARQMMALNRYRSKYDSGGFFIDIIDTGDVPLFRMRFNEYQEWTEGYQSVGECLAELAEKQIAADEPRRRHSQDVADGFEEKARILREAMGEPEVASESGQGAS